MGDKQDESSRSIISKQITLIEELDLGNMLEMFSLADMYDAQELRLASKNLIMDNLHQLVNIKGWKETTSKNLVCEILEGIGEDRHPKKKAKFSSEVDNLLYKFRFVGGS